MKVDEILENSVLTIDEYSLWSKTKSFDELDSMSYDDLLIYVKAVLSEYVDFGFKIHEVANYVKFCQKFKEIE